MHSTVKTRSVWPLDSGAPQELTVESLLLRAVYPHAIPVLLIAKLLRLSWFNLDRAFLVEALHAESDAEFDFASDNFHYRIHNHFFKHWLRIRVSGRKLFRILKRRHPVPVFQESASLRQSG
jgi:hypothetical protein